MIKDAADRSQYIITTAGNSLLMFFAIFCAFGAVISAFSFPIYMWRTSISWLIVCAVLSAVALRYRYKGILILLIPAFVLFLMAYGEITEGARWLIFTLTDYYSNWLVITVFFPESAYYEGDPTTFFIAAGIFVSILLAIAICILRSTFMTALSTVPIVVLTFVVVSDYQQPSFGYIFGLVTVLLTILMANAFAFDDFRKRGIMTIPALVAAVVFLGAAYFANPPDRFDRNVHNEVVNRNFNAIAAMIGNIWERVPNPGQGIGWPGWPAGRPGGLWAFNTRYVDIADAGGINITNQSLLEVEVSTPGTFYLRGYSMQHFDGRTWSINSGANAFNYERDELSRNFPAAIAALHSANQGELPPLVGINITRTGDITNIDYTPYFALPHHTLYAQAGVFDSILYMALDERIRELSRYDMTFVHIQDSVHRIYEELREEGILTQLQSAHFRYGVGGVAGTRIVTDRDGNVITGSEFFRDGADAAIEIATDMDGNAIIFSGYETIIDSEIQDAVVIHAMPDLEPYMQIDEDIAEELRAMASEAGISPNAPRTALVDAIARFVRTSAAYSLSPGVVPEGEDFVLYFLQYMESGFCIHFATAATLMLRSFEIPARFTTGYVFTVPRGYEGQTITLTDQNAHAWVEVFYEDVGWLYLEVTPGGTGSVIPSPSPHSPGERPDNIPPQTPRPDVDHMMDHDDLPMVNGMINGTPDLPIGDQGGADGIASVMGLYPWLFNLIAGTSLIIITLTAILLRRHIVLKSREKRFEQPDSNAAVISMWRYIEKISRREAVPPTDIEDLALKARFSTHKINTEERTHVKKYAKRLADEIYRSKGEYARLWLKYALVVR